MKLEISGLVQGVGFRPFVYRIAVRNGITGWVLNTNEGVSALIQGTVSQISRFKHDLHAELPPAARMDDIAETRVSAEPYDDFAIRSSRSVAGGITDISPDIAVCTECLEDMKTQPHRLDYPFINCTLCGPRFSIIRSIPYDRSNTTMAEFEMCRQCAGEYRDIADRRFHAQPVACNHCGPSYTLHVKGKQDTGFRKILKATAACINAGGIVAMKGIGGYQLVCDAFNARTLERLRTGKYRDGKPFALMARNSDVIRQYCRMNREEERQLNSWRRPIVLMKVKPGKTEEPRNRQLPSGINPGLDSLGFLLPYMPFHYGLFDALSTDVIVFTSGNFSEEPIICDDREALSKMPGIADLILTHNREICNRCDDSVLMVVGGKKRLIRRSRGFVPEFIDVPYNADGILAMGAEMMNTFCVGSGRKAIPGQHTGDLKNPAVTDFYRWNIRRFLQLMRSSPAFIVHDMHPDYYSTRYARELHEEILKETGKAEILPVQHHHAHIVSVMAEYGLDEKVIGVCFDGTGYGTDGHIWGGEFFVCDPEGFERITHLEYIPLPGGDKAVEEPWRTALSLLVLAYREKALDLPLAFNEAVPYSKRRFVYEMIQNKVSSPLSSGAGRVFDAVSALLGQCLVSRFEAEAPMKLEAIIEPGCRKAYQMAECDPILTSGLIRQVTADILRGEKPGIVSAKFHNTMISVIFDRAMKIATVTGIRKVVLSGGVFQNRYLLSGLMRRFAKTSCRLFVPSEIPCNDGGISLGQLYIASKKRRGNVSRGSGKNHIC